MTNASRALRARQNGGLEASVWLAVVWLALNGVLVAGCEEEERCEDAERVLTGSHELRGSQVDKLRCVQIATGGLLLSEVDSLASLEALAEVRGDLTIADSPELSSLQGLQRLARVGGTLRIRSNDALTSLEGLEALEEVGQRLGITELPKLEGLAGLSGLRHVGGDLDISNNAALRSLAALGEGDSATLSVGGRLEVHDNASLESVDFGDNILRGPLVTGGIWIHSNPSLREIANVGRPERSSGACRVGERDLSIFQNDALESVTLVLPVSGRVCIDISRNPRLQRVTGDVSSVVGELRLSELPALEVLQLPGVAEVDSLAIIETGLGTLDGLRASVRCSLDIGKNPALAQLGRLASSPGSVVSTLDVYDNPLLSQCTVAAMIEALPTPAPFACVDPHLELVRLDRLVETRGNDASAACDDEGGG